jgi:TolA-binding protein
MSKPGRNDPCPCGSGQKYKRCCLAKDQAADSAILAEAAEAARATQQAHHDHEHGPWCDFCGHDLEGDEDELTRDSNALVDLVHDGKLDEAERGAREFLVRYPQVHDGYDRLGMVYEARGDKKAAADCYRLCLEFIRSHPEQYGPDPQLATTFEQLVAELDPSPTA